MPQDQFPIPEFPDLTFEGVSFKAVSQRAPDFIATAKWQARLLISGFFLLFATITTVSCYYFGLTEDVFFIATLIGTLLVYLVSMSMLTNAFISSDRVVKNVKQKKRQYYRRALANTPLETRLRVANNIWDTMRSEAWTTCISYAHTADHHRTAHCCQQIGKIASELTHTDPDIFCDAMLKTTNNQRGSVRYFFDILIMLGEHQFHLEHEEQRQVRTTRRIMLDDIFTHR